MIAVVVTTYRGEPQMVDRCLRAVVDGGEATWVLLVDNGGVAEVAGDLAHAVEVIRAPSNRGFGAAANLGFARAKQLGASATALLNDDVVVERGWLRPLVAHLTGGGRVGAVQPKMLVSGSDPPVINSLGVVLDRYGAGTDIGFGEPDRHGDAARGVELFSGGAVLLDAHFLEQVGGFDERYFLYYEDVDLALRGRELGWRYVCDPASRVWHEGSASTARMGDRRAYYIERNRLWCLFRFADGPTMRRGVMLSVRRLRHHPRRAHAAGLLAGLSRVARCARERRTAARSRA